jgi:hypothetical protein
VRDESAQVLVNKTGQASVIASLCWSGILLGVACGRSIGNGQHAE